MNLNNTNSNVLAMFNISFYNVFHISKQGRVTSKVANNDHHQLFALFVVNPIVGVEASIKLKFSRVDKRNGLSFISFIWLWGIFDMILPQIFNGFRFDNPVVFGRIGSF